MTQSSLEKGLQHFEITFAFCHITALCWKCCPLAEPLEGTCECSSRVPEHDLPAGFKLLWWALERMPGHCWVQCWAGDPDGQQAAVPAVTGFFLFPLLESFSDWLLAVYKFLLMLKTLVRDMWLHAFSRQKCQQNYPQAPVRASVWLFLIPLTKCFAGSSMEACQWAMPIRKGHLTQKKDLISVS